MASQNNNPETNDASIFAPIRPDYADFAVPVEKSFSWDGILEALRVPTGKFVVLYAFRSVKNPDVNEELLQLLDDRALMAAQESEQLLHYEPNPGLSYCLWVGSVDAKEAIGSPEHREAAAYAKEAYGKHELQSWLIGRIGVSGEAIFIPRTNQYQHNTEDLMSSHTT